MPGLEVKRWIVLLALSILLVDLGVAYLLKAIYGNVQFPAISATLTLQFLPHTLRAAIFGLVGVALLVFSFLRLQSSVLGPFLPGGSEVGIVDTIFAFRQRGRGPRVVAIGGGTGLSTLLRGLKEYSANLAAIVTVADDGGSSGRLREEYRILPPGDFRQCLVALADAEPLVKQLFDHRFADGSLGGHSFGNLFIMAMADVTGDFEHALQASGRVLRVQGSIVPSTLQDVTLCATVNGSTVEGESKIPKQHGPISRVFLKPDLPAINPEAALAILNSELIVVGPGSLYTSVLPNLLVDGMVQAIKSSPALKVFVCNVASQDGETDGFSVGDYLDVLEQHVGSNLFDYVICNSNLSHEPTGGQTRVIFDPVEAAARDVRFILADVVNERIPSHHDPEKLSKLIMKKVWQA